MQAGTASELLRINGAQLFLLDGEESVQMAEGDFVLILMVQAHTPLAVLVAQVGDVQWPVGKDGPVLRLSNRRYAFYIPSFLYGLTLVNDVPLEKLQQFEALMQQYSTFEYCPDIASSAGLTGAGASNYMSIYDDPAEVAFYWTSVTPDVESYSRKLAKRIRSGSTIAADKITKGVKWATTTIHKSGTALKNIAPQGTGDGEEMSPRMRKRVEQARRMSAVAKLLSKTVLKGAINISGHVANTLGTAMASSGPVRAFLSSDSRREIAVASVDAFSLLVEAVESAGKSLGNATSAVGSDLLQFRYGEQAGQVAQDSMGAVGNVITTMWTLNKVGLRMLWNATAQSAAMQIARSGTKSNASSDNSLSSSTFSSGSTISRQSSGLVNRQLSPPSADIGGSVPAEAQDYEIGHVVRRRPPKTAQLFPGSSLGLVCAESNYSGNGSPHNFYLPPQGVPSHATTFTTFLPPAPHHPNSPFQHYIRPGEVTPTQPYFHTRDADYPETG